jgi:hypothetical protein
LKEFVGKSNRNGLPILLAGKPFSILTRTRAPFAVTSPVVECHRPTENGARRLFVLFAGTPPGRAGRWEVFLLIRAMGVFVSFVFSIRGKPHEVSSFKAAGGRSSHESGRRSHHGILVRPADA